ncbi:tail fiber assembly protein, partial [Shigella flexneri]|nr:phage tail protein [Shigella flexneri]EGA6783532.1 tail fiber assembly protein [Shigella flexneri]
MSITLDLILQCRPVQDMVHLLMRITLQWDINEMSYFYSASTNGFYSTEFHGTNIPDDAVEISESEWK